MFTYIYPTVAPAVEVRNLLADAKRQFEDIMHYMHCLEEIVYDDYACQCYSDELYYSSL